MIGTLKLVKLNYEHALFQDGYDKFFNGRSIICFHLFFKGVFVNTTITEVILRNGKPISIKI